MLAVRLVEHLSVCLDTELAPVNILAPLVTFLLGHSLATLVWNTFTVLLGDGLAVLLGHRSNKGFGESPKLVLYYQLSPKLRPASLSRFLLAHFPVWRFINISPFVLLCG